MLDKQKIYCNKVVIDLMRCTQVWVSKGYNPPKGFHMNFNGKYVTDFYSLDELVFKYLMNIHGLNNIEEQELRKSIMLSHTNTIYGVYRSKRRND